MKIFNRNKHVQLAVNTVIDEFLLSEGFTYDDAAYHDNYGLTKLVEKLTSDGVTESYVYICIGMGRVSVYEETPLETILCEYEVELDESVLDEPTKFAQWLEDTVR